MGLFVLELAATRQDRTMNEAEANTHMPPSRAKGVWADLERLLRRVPLCALAVVLVLAAMVVKYKWPSGWTNGFKLWGRWVDMLDYPIWLALFLPGAIRQGSWRYALAAIPLAGLAMGLSIIAPSLEDAAWRVAPYSYGIEASPLLLVAFAQWLFTRPRSPRSLGWLMLLAFSTISVVSAVLIHVELTGWRIDVYPYLNEFLVDATDLLWPLLYAFFGWYTIGVALWALTKSKVGRPVLVAACLAILALPLFVEAGVLPWARLGIQSGHPYPRGTSAWLLGARGRQADLGAMWAILDKHDWKPVRDPSLDGWPFEFCRAWRPSMKPKSSKPPRIEAPPDPLRREALQEPAAKRRLCKPRASEASPGGKDPHAARAAKRRLCKPG